MKVILCDTDPAVLDAWRAEFTEHPGVEIRASSLLEIESAAVVNPGNAFGFMDGGLSLSWSERFGFGFEDLVKKTIREKYGGEMLVGQAEVFRTGREPPFLVYAPIVRTPQRLKTSLNPYLAARAALRAVRAFQAAGGGEDIGAIAFPGLGTGPEEMPPRISARQLRYAYEEATGMRLPVDQNLSRLARREKKLKSMPLSAEEDSEG
jgi:O-acetyl-ADP-ribose deacetylase (regulator of RNase III)